MYAENKIDELLHHQVTEQITYSRITKVSHFLLYPVIAASILIRYFTSPEFCLAITQDPSTFADSLIGSFIFHNQIPVTSDNILSLVT